MSLSSMAKYLCSCKSNSFDCIFSVRDWKRKNDRGRRRINTRSNGPSQSHWCSNCTLKSPGSRHNIADDFGFSGIRNAPNTSYSPSRSSIPYHRTHSPNHSSEVLLHTPPISPLNSLLTDEISPSPVYLGGNTSRISNNS